MFKKRKLIQNNNFIRKDELSALEETDESQINPHPEINNISKNLLHRKKTSGIAVTNIEDYSYTKQSAAQNSYTQEKFLSKKEEVPSIQIAHKKAMEDFTSTKRGVQKKETFAKEYTAEDALYMLPNELRVDGNEAEILKNSGRLAWSAGIAEVELPAEFKRRTQVATAKATKAINEVTSSSKGHNVQSSGAHASLAAVRFGIIAKPNNSREPHDTPSVPSTKETSIATSSRRESDNIGLEQFKKRQKTFL